MPHSIRKLLLDITLSCEEIVDFTREKSFEEFLADRLLQLALEREFEIIGEAIARLERLDPDRIETKIPEFRKIIGFRNIIAHGYDVIDDASLWDFAKNKVPELLQKAKDF
ncbi:MAG: DUF86 domain-containing protein [Verrucomicrobiae bacterium]|nr:DUF86 domain-containing protein [Verrucomicrobiae bacterium]